MSNSTSLLFIPDISGFTEFVHQTASEHSNHIVSELLELLIDQNDIGLQLAEVEGDALFFYKFREMPDQQAFFDQVRKMYNAFHQHLKYYETHRICHCGACRTAHSLQLKFVAHAGDFRFIEVKGTRKPFGEEVIAAHRLLKNSVPAREYLLLTQALWDQLQSGRPDGNPGGTQDARPLSDTYDFGKIDYKYLDIGPWREEVAEVPVETQQELANKLFETEFEVSRPLEEVFELLTNFKYRLKWTTGLDDFKYEEDRVNRLGSKHICVINDKNVSFKTITRDFGSQYRVYGERTEEIPGFQYVDSYYLLEEKEEDRIAVIVRAYGKPRGILGKLIRPVVRRSLGKSILESVRLFRELSDSGFQVATS